VALRAVSVGVAAVAGAAAGPGGVLLAAPGTPCGPGVVVLFSLVCSLRSFCGSPF